MTTTRRLGLPLAALGAVFGLAISQQPLLTLLGILSILIGLVCIARPYLLISLMFSGILFDRLGETGVSFDAFPITASKLTVLASIAAWGVHVLLSRTRPLLWHPVLTAMSAMVLVTAVQLVLTDTLSVGKFNLAAGGMMTILVALTYTILASRPLQPLYRYMGALFLGALVLTVVATRTATGRSSGTMGDPNEWATIVLLLTPILLGGLVDDTRPVYRLVRMALLLLAPLVILMSMSRTALAVGLLITPACVLLFRERRRELGTCLAAALAGTPLVVDLEQMLFRVRQLIVNLKGGAVIEDVSLTERRLLLEQGLQVFRDHWLLGAGPGNGPMASGYTSLTGRLRPVHNSYLEVASEQGIIGLLFMSMFLGAVAWTMYTGLRRSPRGAHQNRIIGLVTGMAALALMASTLGLLTFAMAYLMLGFGLAVVHHAEVRADA
ncbi:MAG: O-antigen ligase family protein [Myxococcota bacterium]|nr:O-antigen ligase family protein [Myxococcota bacterium]